MSDSSIFGLSAFKQLSPKEKALVKLREIILLFTEEHDFDLDNLEELRLLILSIEEVKK